MSRSTLKIKPLPVEKFFTSLTINLTNKCNTYCKYCFRDSKKSAKDEIELKDIKRILFFFQKKQANVIELYLQLTGGEIFLYPNIFEIIKLALSLGYTLRLQTNGLLFNKMNHRQLEIFSSKKIIIKISLDGWNSKIHELYRAKGSFDKVVSGIKIIRKYNKNIAIKTVVQKLNFPQIYKMLDICLDLGARGFSYNILRPEGRGIRIKEPIKEIDVIKKLIPYFNQKKYKFLLNGTNILVYYSMQEPTAKISKGFYINFDGNIYPTQECNTKQKIGSIFSRNLLKEFDTTKFPNICFNAPVDAFEYVKKNLKQ